MRSVSRAWIRQQPIRIHVITCLFSLSLVSCNTNNEEPVELRLATSMTLVELAMTSGNDKTEAPPLLHSGNKVIGFWQLDQYFFTPFVTWNEEAQRRKYLVTNLSRYITELRKFGIPFQIWIDGSFTTTKTDPDDIDLVVWANGLDLAGLTPNQQVLFERLTIERETIRAQYDLDVFLSLEGNQQEADYWTDLYSKGHNGREKGFFKIELFHV